MHNRSTFMKSVWAHFRRVALPGRPFCWKLFAQVLAFMWKGERTRLDAECEHLARTASAPIILPVEKDKPLSEIQARIDGLKYLSARYRIDLMAAEIRAEYAHA